MTDKLARSAPLAASTSARPAYAGPVSRSISARALVAWRFFEAARQLGLPVDAGRASLSVAAALGFTIAQALHRAFRRWTGQTIQAHRAALGR